jgi:hypothetical protein
MKILVVGGGIFGCSVAIELSKSGFDVTLIEKSSRLLSKATRYNHNRIHYGYHYPRSKETALQSLDGLVSFLTSYKDSIVTEFPNYYAIAKLGSLVNSTQYKNFCDKVGISYRKGSPQETMLNREMIEESFMVEEPIYDWEIINQIILGDLAESGTNVLLETPFTKKHMDYEFIINCSYSGINEVNEIAGVEKLNFKLQDVIVPTFQYNHPKIGLTVMDGPFCSIMPQGKENNRFLLYHAKYSIIRESMTGQIERECDIQEVVEILKEDSSKYFPFIKEANFGEVWRETRVIPLSNNDERLSRVITYKENPNFVTVFSGKVSTCIKIAKQIKHGLYTGDFNNNITI